MLTDTGKSAYAKVKPVESKKLKWTGGFWKEVTDTVSKNTVSHLLNMFEAADISHVLENFRIVAGEKEGKFAGTPFGDGDFYKWMESAVYASAYENDEKMLKKLDGYIDLIGRCQQEDGYLSTKQILDSRNGSSTRLKDINEFEVYNMGHMFTSACLYYRMTGKDNFLRIAEKTALYLKKMYEDAEKNGNVQTAVCPSHYMGLIELYRTTGKQVYLDIAKKSIELRDSVKNGLDDNQDRYPLKTHRKMLGHAVRATYLYAGVADLYLENGDEEYLTMLLSVWDNMINTKFYITGGIGALYNGVSPYGNFFKDQKTHQAFGYEYQLPNITAYNETCASVGLVMFAYRMFLINPDPKYMDVIERVLLNVNMGALSLNGKGFFYENMLRRTKSLEYEVVWPLERSEYISSYCCPPNLARNLMQSVEYAFTNDETSVYTGIYGECTAKIGFKNGMRFMISEKTGYPYDGKIVFTFENIENPAPFTLKIRIPEWAEKACIYVNDEQITLTEESAGSYYGVYLKTPKNSRVEVCFDMPVRFIQANPMVEEDTYQVAVERGPLVYCIESMDTDTEELSDVVLDINESFTPEEIEIEGRKLLSLTGKAFIVKRKEYKKNALYQPVREYTKEKEKIRLIPYYAWSNRGYSEMKIWMPFRV